MRKLLLASAAIMGATVGLSGIASAQGNGTWSTTGTSADIRPPISQATSAMTYPVGGGQNPVISQLPGNIAVHLNGKIRTWIWGLFDTGSTNTPAGGSQSPFIMQDYLRFTLGFDGTAANGLRYGAASEIRHDALAVAGSNAITASPATFRRSRAAVYAVQAYGYLATDSLGMIRAGTSYSPQIMLGEAALGLFETIGDGGFNGDFSGLSGAMPAWPFADGTGSHYGRTGIQYYTPQFAGFQLGMHFSPNGAAMGGNDGCAVGGYAGAGCARLTTTPLTAELARQTSFFTAALRYRGVFNGVGVGAFVDYTASGQMGYNGVDPRTAAQTYKGLSVVQFGGAVTFSGFQVGGGYVTGAFNPAGWGSLQKSLKNTTAFLLGAQYNTGPLTVGTHYVNSKSAGNNAYALTSGVYRAEQGILVAGSYAIAPGLTGFVEGAWGERKQPGFNFSTGAAGASPTGANIGKVNGTVLGLGLGFQW